MSLSIDDIEEHFLYKIDEGYSTSELMEEFADLVDAHFSQFPRKYNGAKNFYGVMTDDDNWLNIFVGYNENDDEIFGFQCFRKRDGTIQGWRDLKSRRSDDGEEIIDFFMHMAANVGKFAH